MRCRGGVCSCRALAFALLAPALLTPEALGSQKPARKPNIIVIVADDLGYADLGCQGCKDIRTPNIDSIARNGVRFTSGYVSAPYCSPTRAGLMTGRYQNRFGHEFNPGPAEQSAKNFGLPLTETTIADMLKALGYRTGLVGKWHLGYQPRFHPEMRGFDEFFGFLGGAHSYTNATADKANPILRGKMPVDEKAYLTEAFTREAVAFIERHKKGPFFLTLTYNAVHAPLQAPQKYLKRAGKFNEKKRRLFAGMLTALDDGVGAVLAKVRELGLEENTLIFFLSDNGGPTQQTSSRNTPLRGVKAQLWEGGVRVPFLVQWKGQFPAGKTYDQPIIALDVLPTALAAAGGSPAGKNKLDGVDLLPHLTGKVDRPPHEFLLWRFGKQWAVRKGNWKLSNVAGTLQLSDLATDIGETKDVSAKQAEVLTELQTAYFKWDSELAKPRWRPKGKEAAASEPARPFLVEGEAVLRANDWAFVPQLWHGLQTVPLPPTGGLHEAW